MDLKTNAMNSQAIKTETIDDNIKGLCVYEKPFVFRITEDRKRFYYSEVGILVSCRFYDESETTNPIHENKFCVDFEHDYRSADDLENFGFVRNTGTYGNSLYFDTLEDAIKGVLDFANSEFTQYRTFSRELIPQIKKASIREVAKSQCLHHYASYDRLYNSNDFRMKIIEASGELETLNKYIATNERRKESEFKYRDKLSKRFFADFGFDVRNCVFHFKMYLTNFKKLAKIEDFEELTPRQKNTVKKALQYYNL